MVKKLSKIDFWIAFFLFISTIVWRIPFFVIGKIPWGYDEWQATITTFQILRDVKIPIFVLGQTYFAPIQELFSAFLFALRGPSLFALRLPGAVFYGLAVSVIYLSLRNVFSRKISILSCILLSFGNSLSTWLTGLASPDNGAGIFLISLVLIFTIYLDRKRTICNWIIFGILSGFSSYAYPISSIQIIVSLVWLSRRSIEIEKVGLQLKKGKLLAILLIGGFSSLALGTYRFLTRRNVYTPTIAETVLVATGLALLLLSVLVYIRIFKFSIKQYTAVLIFLLFFLIIGSLPTLYFHTFEKPVLENYDVVIKSAPYNLRHYRMWPNQIKILLELTFPMLILGNVKNMVGGNVLSIALGWKWIFSTVLFIPTLFWMAYRTFFQFFLRKRPNIEVLVYLPFILMLVIALPSWYLCNDMTCRHFIPFMFGFTSALIILLDRFFMGRRKTVLYLIIMAYIIYCAYDAWTSVPNLKFSNEVTHLYDNLQSAEVDSVIAPEKTIRQLQWLSNDTLNLLNSSLPRTNYFYNKDLFFSRANKIARINVGDEQWNSLVNGIAKPLKKIRSDKNNVTFYQYNRLR